MRPHWHHHNIPATVSKKSLDLSKHQFPDLWRYAMTTDVLLLSKIHVQELERKWNTRIFNQWICLIFFHKKFQLADDRNAAVLPVEAPQFWNFLALPNNFSIEIQSGLNAFPLLGTIKQVRCLHHVSHFSNVKEQQRILIKGQAPWGYILI